MLLLLLVSIQAKITTMEVYELKLDLIRDKNKKLNQSSISSDKEKILCIHCNRTATNGIRCLGICVADNDY